MAGCPRPAVRKKQAEKIINNNISIYFVPFSEEKGTEKDFREKPQGGFSETEKFPKAERTI